MSIDETRISEAAAELAEVDDRELTLAFKRGDSGAYEAIYERHSGRVHNVCRRMLRRPEEAQEAAQETFLRMYRALPKFNGKYQLGAWITRIATNVCLDQLRSQGRHPVDLTPFDELQLVAHEAAEGVEPESVYMRSSEGWRVRRVLDSLPPMHKAAIVLRDFEGLSYEEVAQALGISDAQTKALIHRARQGFKRSWSASVASLFFPAKLIERLRTVDLTAREHAVQAISPASQVMVNCNVALQQCGQFFTERAATLVTAGVVATAAVSGAAVINDRPAEGSRPAGTSVAVSEEVAQRQRSAGDIAVSDRVKKPQRVAAPSEDSSEDKGTAPVEEEPAPAVTPAPVEPTPAPTPSTEPTSPPPATGGGSVGSEKPVEPVPPEPTGYAMTANLTGPATPTPCDCRWPTEVRESRVVPASTGIASFTHKVRGSLAVAGEAHYGMDLSLASSDMRALNMGLLLWTAEGSYTYNNSGSIVERKTTAWGGSEYHFAGTYSKGSGATSHEYVPAAGRFSLVVTYAPKQARITSVALAMTENGS